MNVMNYLDYNRIADVRRTMLTNDIDGRVIKTNTNPHNGSESGKELQDFSTSQDNRRVLPTKDVIDFAVNSDLKKDKSLIGSESSIESLDVSKAISNAQKNSIIKEYQTFVQNPKSDRVASEDGIIVRKNNI